MCGIAGYFGAGNEEIVRRMTRSLQYRGPDGEGVNVLGRVGLGHRRLSIIDTSQAGAQPMSNEDETIWISFNGEIYNFKELKEGLPGHHRFSSATDTEVIVHLYEELGEKAFAQLEGMFSFALYDSRRDALFLVRDRLGQKPLYWGLFAQTLVFGSELKAVLAHPQVTKELNYEALQSYLALEYVPTPLSIIKGVHKLPPGHYACYDGSDITLHQYWQVRFTPPSSLSFADAVHGFDEELSRAVQRRLMSDVPLGLLLSGGLDSSAVAYYAQRASSAPIKTFSLGFDEKSFDETASARLVAKHLGCDHYEERLSGAAMTQLIPEIFSFLDEPLADASIIPTYAVSRFARQHITTALSGDGGDELLLGYDTFAAEPWAQWYALLPRPVRQQLARAAEKLPTSFSNISLDFKIKRFTAGLCEDDNVRHLAWLGAFSRNAITQVLTAKAQEQLSRDPYAPVLQHIQHSDAQDAYQRLIHLYLRSYLLDGVLAKVDRASMHASLEVRSPFLDHQLAEFVNALPTAYKKQGSVRKRLLRSVMADRLPSAIMHKPKKGFGMPVAQWLTGPLRDQAQSMLSPAHLEAQGIFDQRYVQRLLHDHLERRADNRKQLWTLLVFQWWWEEWM